MAPPDPRANRPRKPAPELAGRRDPMSLGSGREQEQSIRARKELLFEEDDLPARGPAAAPTRPFPDYLRTTPAAPLSGVTRAMLWGAGLLVVVLFVASIFKGGASKAPRGKPAAPQAGARR